MQRVVYDKDDYAIAKSILNSNLEKLFLQYRGRLSGAQADAFGDLVSGVTLSVSALVK